MDKITNPRNDIKVIQRPGGNSSINLGWEEAPPKNVKKPQKPESPKEEELQLKDQEQPQQKQDPTPQEQEQY